MKHYGKIGYTNVNYMCVIDNKFKIMIIKKPKRRYRTIIRNFYRYGAKRQNRNM